MNAGETDHSADLAAVLAAVGGFAAAVCPDQREVYIVIRLPGRRSARIPVPGQLLKLEALKHEKGAAKGGPRI